MSIQLGVSLGPSFAEYCLVKKATNDSNPIEFQRVYTPTENIAVSLRRFLSENKENKPDRMLVASNRLEKILATKLGGSVAQVATKGFENWPLLRQSLQNQYFELQPQRTEALASQDLIFGINERINFKGEILKPLDISELEEISKKLKEKKIEKICINLLFSDKHPIHQKKVIHFFVENGFSVFPIKDISDTENDEILSWRKNLLNASLSGTFKDIKSELIAATEGILDPSQIFFIDGDSTLFNETVQGEQDHISSSLFGPAQAIAKFYHKNSQVLVLGTEKWYFLKPHSRKKTWQSPWGPLTGFVPEVQNLEIQPTSELIVSDFEEFTWTHEPLGYEPGPMSFGRALKPQLFDLIQFRKKQEDFSSLVNEAGLVKFKNTITAMKRNTKEQSRQDLAKTVEELYEYGIDQIGMHVLLNQNSLEKNNEEKIICTGVFSLTLFSDLKIRWPEINWELCPRAQEIESLAVASKGLNT